MKILSAPAVAVVYSRPTLVASLMCRHAILVAREPYLFGRRHTYDVRAPWAADMVSPPFSPEHPVRDGGSGDLVRVAIPAPCPGAKKHPHRADDVGDARHPGADVVR